MPLVSVIIPTFNRYAVGRAISSVFQQTVGLENMELIVVDDCSSEKFRNFLHLYEVDQTLRKTFVFSDENRGPGYCRNLAITMAAGKYILFLDSDDFLPSYALKEMVAVAQQMQSEIVSGKRLHLDGITPNASVFQKTLLKSSVYDTMSSPLFMYQ